MKNGQVSYGQVEPTSLKRKERGDEKWTSVLRASRAHLPKRERKMDKSPRVSRTHLFKKRE